MNLPLIDGALGRQRSRQWMPLVTQQCRLRHVCQIFGFNLPPLVKKSGYYFTLHLTAMSSPFYTSERIDSLNAKWPEIDQRNLTNLAASAIVIRIWCQQSSDINVPDKIISTWGVNLSGLVYLGGKIAEIQPSFFAQNTVIFCMRGGYFTSPKYINFEAPRPPPFSGNLNLTAEDRSRLFKRTSMPVAAYDVRDSYNLDKLRRLQSLQISIRNKRLDVQNVRDRIEVKCGASHVEEKGSSPTAESLLETAGGGGSSSQYNVRYATQLLTMNSLNKMLEEKPTKTQRKEMIEVRKKIEVAQFRTKLLSQERDKKSAQIRRYKKKLKELVEENEAKNMELMNSYYQLSKELERLKELKKQIVHNQECLLSLHSQMFYRQKQLMQELLFIYPIEHLSDKKYTIHGIYLPNSDILSDCSDVGISVALGYVTHVIVMCSSFMQVPLRYPLTHYGSRSSITDNISPMLPDREREFPLFTKGKDKMQFTYAVYLLNKNIAQLRWNVFMNTPELKATLPNLLTLLQGNEAKDVCCLVPTYCNTENDTDNTSESLKENYNFSFSELSLAESLSISTSNAETGVASSASVSSELFQDGGGRSANNSWETSKQCISKMYRSSESGPGLSEILAIPEALLNKQISAESFKIYGAMKRSGAVNSCSTNQIVIKEGRITGPNQNCDKNENTPVDEQGTDLLDPGLNMAALAEETDLEIPKTQPEHSSCGDGKTDEVNRKENVEENRILLDRERDTEISNEKDTGQLFTVKLANASKDGVLEIWSPEGQDVLVPSSDGSECAIEKKSVQNNENPLTARTDALLNTKSFNLVRPRANS